MTLKPNDGTEPPTEEEVNPQVVKQLNAKRRKLSKKNSNENDEKNLDRPAQTKEELDLQAAKLQNIHLSRTFLSTISILRNQVEWLDYDASQFMPDGGGGASGGGGHHMAEEMNMSHRGQEDGMVNAANAAALYPPPPHHPYMMHPMFMMGQQGGPSPPLHYAPYSHMPIADGTGTNTNTNNSNNDDNNDDTNNNNNNNTKEGTSSPSNRRGVNDINDQSNTANNDNKSRSSNEGNNDSEGEGEGEENNNSNNNNNTNNSNHPHNESTTPTNSNNGPSIGHWNMPPPQYPGGMHPYPHEMMYHPSMGFDPRMAYGYQPPHQWPNNSSASPVSGGGGGGGNGSNARGGGNAASGHMDPAMMYAYDSMMYPMAGWGPGAGAAQGGGYYGGPYNLPPGIEMPQDQIGVGNGNGNGNGNIVSVTTGGGETTATLANKMNREIKGENIDAKISKGD